MQSAKRTKSWVFPYPTCPMLPSGLQQQSGSGIALLARAGGPRGKSFRQYNSLCLISNVLRSDLFCIEHMPPETEYTGYAASRHVLRLRRLISIGSVKTFRASRRMWQELPRSNLATAAAPCATSAVLSIIADFPGRWLRVAYHTFRFIP